MTRGLCKHTYIHIGEDPYHFDICGKSVYRTIKSCGLTKHKCTHTGEKPFMEKKNPPYHCYVCGKLFSQNGPLTIHSEEKAYY
uniref:C2H2-type domain-containing protein n=1 Tax=Octopus bimaculoides TaxID=37653 RepID=A0A0L8FGJ8_OCTBM